MANECNISLIMSLNKTLLGYEITKSRDQRAESKKEFVHIELE